MMLTIDTSGALSGLAITNGDRLIAEQQWQSGRRHSEQVLPQLDALCRLVGVEPQEFTHIIVARGPGSWSGIRVGMSIAKGLVLATDATLIGIASLDAMAWALRGSACHAMTSLGRGRFAVASYPADPWAPGSIDARNIAQIEPWHDAPIVCDADTAAAVRAIDPAAPIRVVWPRPLDYALLGVEVIAHHVPSTFLCEPIYLGDPVQRS